jgi:hypothetical protein
MQLISQDTNVTNTLQLQTPSFWPRSFSCSHIQNPNRNFECLKEDFASNNIASHESLLDFVATDTTINAQPKAG